MRMIDADALIEFYEDVQKATSEVKYPKIPIGVIIANINDAPTIEPSGDLISREVYEDKVEYYETKIEYLEGELEKHQPRVGTSDLISRADAVEAICGTIMSEFDYPPTAGYEIAEKALKTLPSSGTECTDFIHWISRVVTDDELWELNAVGYGEIICRKLVKIGALATTEKPPYYYVPYVSAEPKRWKWSGQFISEMQDTAIELLQKTGWMQEHDKQISEPKHGEWIDIVETTNVGVEYYDFECCVCGHKRLEATTYCPNCGAYMGKGKSDD